MCNVYGGNMKEIFASIFGRVNMLKYKKSVARILIWVIANIGLFILCSEYSLLTDVDNCVLLVFALIGGLGFLKGKEVTVLFKLHPVICGGITVLTAFQICGYRLFFVNEKRLFSVLLFLVIIVWTSYYLNGIMILIKWLQKKIIVKPEKRSNLSRWLIFAIVFGIIIVIEALMMYIYYPGIYSADSLVCYQAASNILVERSDIHSFLYVCLIALCLRISENCIVLVTVCGVVFALVFAFYMRYLYQQGLRASWIIGGTLIFCLMPNNAYMIISVWKDVPYTISLISLTYALTKWVFEKEKVEKSFGSWLHIIISAIFVALFRSNGLAVLLGMIILVGVVAIKYVSMRKLFISILLAGIIVLGIKLPIYTVLDVKGTPDGFASIPFIDGIWANANAGVELPDEISREMEKLFPYDDWKERYRQGRSNVSIWDLDEYNKLSLENVIKWYGWCVVNSPKYTIQNRLMKTDFMWSYFRNKGADFSFNCAFDELQNDVILDRGANEFGWYHFENTHYLRIIFHRYIYYFYEHFQIWLRGGIYLTIWLALCAKAIFDKRKKVLVVVLPILLSTSALMLGACYGDYRFIWGMEVMTWFILPIFMLSDKKYDSRGNMR